MTAKHAQETVQTDLLPYLPLEKRHFNLLLFFSEGL